METTSSSGSQPKLILKENSPSEFSPLSILIGLVLGVTFIVLIQFLIRDLRESFYGKEPRSSEIQTNYASRNTSPYQEKTTYTYKGVTYSTYEEAQNAFNQDKLLPYKTGTLLISGIVNIPLFLLSLYLFFVFRSQRGNGKKLASFIFFGATLINIIVLLGEISHTLYRVNPRIAVYTISIALIAVLTLAIIKIQERFHKPSGA